VKCPSKCVGIGTAARKIAAERNHLRTQGSKKRDELVKKAVVMKKELEDNIESTKLKIQGTAVKVRELAEKLKEVERSERSKVVKQPAQGGKYPMVVQVAQQKIEEYKGLLTKLREERNEAEKRLLVTEGILKAFKEEYNPNFNDEGVKRAVRAWEEYLAAGNDGVRRNTAEDRELTHIIDTETIDWTELAGEAEDEGSERMHSTYAL
jgi:protein kinase C substrate 80K-H